MRKITWSRASLCGVKTPVASLVIALITLSLQTGQAEAQWGMGYGMFNFNYVPQEVSFLNKRSLELTNKATMGPRQNNVYANNPNSYINHLHDGGYLDKYDVSTQRSIEASIGRYSEDYPTRTPAPRPVATNPPRTPAPAVPYLPLSSFFDRYSKLVWPDVAPTWGDLADKRNTSDLASLAVMNEYNLKGLAALSTVTDARTKLLDYGRPALEYVRQNSTPRLADTFHMFLLSLYESLAQAATVPKTATPPAAPN